MNTTPPKMCDKKFQTSVGDLDDIPLLTKWTPKIPKVLLTPKLKNVPNNKNVKKNIKNVTKIGYGPLFCKNKKESEQKRE
jgi:hypothetical protein